MFEDFRPYTQIAHEQNEPKTLNVKCKFCECTYYVTILWAIFTNKFRRRLPFAADLHVIAWAWMFMTVRKLGHVNRVRKRFISISYDSFNFHTYSEQHKSIEFAYSVRRRRNSTRTRHMISNLRASTRRTRL